MGTESNKWWKIADWILEFPSNFFTYAGDAGDSGERQLKYRCIEDEWYIHKKAARIAPYQ